MEFSTKNSNTYSIEFAHLLFASSSEVDVIFKQMCKLINPNFEVNGIDNYRPIILERLPRLKNESVYVDRYGLSFKPWVSWRPGNSPFWWQSYNKVKHQRDEYFERANLINALRSMGALLIVAVYYYYLVYEQRINLARNNQLNLQDVTQNLTPNTELLTLEDAYYYNTLIG